MNKKGFTLIEVIGVIVVMSIIILMVVPNISDSLTSSRNKAFDVQIEEIKSATKSWSILNSNNLPADQDDEIIINLLQLKLAGLLDKDFTNPITGELFPDDMQVKITKKGLSYIYTVLTDTGSSSDDTVDPLGPQIVLNGSTYMYVEVNTSPTIPGAVYLDDNGTNINVTNIKYEVKNGDSYIETNSINFNELSSYVITYSATLNGRTNSIKRYIEIVDTTPPIISINGYQDNVCVDIEMSDSFLLPTATITDNYSTFIKPVIIGNISKVPGIKRVTYKATDDNENSSEFVLCINMKDTKKPIIADISKSYSVALGYEIITVTAYDDGVGLHKNAYSFDGGVTWQSDNYFIVDNGNVDITVVVRDKIGLQSDSQTIIEKIEPEEFAYEGSVQTYTARKSGYYKIEAWGAQGGYGLKEGSQINVPGKGAYTSGVILLEKGENLYIYVGGQGGSAVNTSPLGGTAGYNGGGAGGADNNETGTGVDPGGGGGGATDIRYFGEYDPTEEELLWNSESGLNSRIMVAGGGGGSSYASIGGYGGTLVGGDGNTSIATGGSQLSGNAFGIGATGITLGAGTSGGGGGYYGGNTSNTTDNSAAGGSSFISGYAGVNAITSSTSRTHTGNTMHYSNKYFVNTKMQAGVNEGNGKVIISYVSEEKPEILNSKLNSVRYIKDCINGSSQNTYNHWVELQAIKDGVNVALNKNVTSTGTSNSSLPFSRITDGDITSSNYAQTDSTGLQCVTVDLGSTYNLDEIAVWHYWDDGRIYNSNVTYVSSDNSTWEEVINTAEAETSNGKRVNAYEIEKVSNYAYSDSYRKYIAPVTGYYKIELWGAQGGSYSSSVIGGKGAYTSGNVYLEKNESLYFYVGGAGSSTTGGYNGGGNGAYQSADNTRSYAGGGATDVRYFGEYDPTEEELLWNSILGLNSRIMVAAGGGGCNDYGGSSSPSGGYGGALTGGGGGTYSCGSSSLSNATGGTQTSGGIHVIEGNDLFGIGSSMSSVTSYGGGGGSGYYGGGAGGVSNCIVGSGAGGSSFISGYTGSVAITSSTDRTPKTGCTNGTTDIACSYHYSGKIFTDTVMKAGNASMPTQDGTSTMTGNSGNGYAKITYIGSE